MNTFEQDKRFREADIVYVLTGSPIPLKRPRHGQKRTWNPQKELQLIARITLQQQHNDRVLLTGPLQLCAEFFMPIALSWSEKKRNKYHGVQHCTIPDLSNLIKFVEDAAHDALYSNDSYISSIIAQKIYSLEPRTEFTITELAL